MRPATIVLLASIAIALLFGFLGQAVDSDALYLISGASFLVAVVTAIVMIPWVRNLPWPPRMQGTFPRLSRGERLDPFSGERR